jgi:activating signal cointegrator 1
MKIKAITLWQPWATLMAIGVKRFETRSWGTGYKGPIAIHAAKRPINVAEINYHMRLVLGDHGIRKSEFSLGQVVAIGYLKKVYPTWCQDAVMVGPETVSLPPPLTSLERSFGDWSQGRCAWLVTDMWQLDPPIPARGRQGLWDWQMPEHLVTEYQEWQERLQWTTH